MTRHHGIAQYIFEIREQALSGEEWKDNIWENRAIIETTAKTYSYSYEGLIPGRTYDLRVIVVDQAGNELKATNYATIPGKYEYIGRTVDYMPTAGQTYEIVATTYSGYNTKQTFSTSDITEGWKVWDMDDENLYLISTQSTGNGSKKLTLSNYQGYNNGVTLLDTLCDTCFTNKTAYAGMTGRNLKLSDVTAVTTVENDYKKKYGTRPNEYALRFPWIWEQYEKSDTEQGAKDWENNKEKAYDLTTNITTYAYKYRPYYSYWENTQMDAITAWMHEEYFKMVMLKTQTSNTDNNYWLSSRFVNPVTNGTCWFGLQMVTASGIDGGMICNYGSVGDPGGSARGYAVRPLVSIPLSSCYLTEGGTGGADLHIGSMSNG